MRKLMKYTLISLLLLAFFYCKSISHKSSSDEIIDYSAKKISKEILSNYIEKEKKTIGVATFSKEDLEDKQVNTLGLFLANSIHNEMFNPASSQSGENGHRFRLKVDTYSALKNHL